jgi:hypothetical protein
MVWTRKLHSGFIGKSEVSFESKERSTINCVLGIEYPESQID